MGDVQPLDDGPAASDPSESKKERYSHVITPPTQTTAVYMGIFETRNYRHFCTDLFSTRIAAQTPRCLLQCVVGVMEQTTAVLILSRGRAWRSSE